MGKDLLALDAPIPLFYFPENGKKYCDKIGLQNKNGFFFADMYTKEQKKALVKDFWVHFDNYCNLQPELAWRKKKWVLHRTGIPHVDLKFDPGRKQTQVMIELNHRDEDKRMVVFEQLMQYREVLESGLDQKLHWELVYTRHTGQEVSRIYAVMENVDIHRRSDWHQMFQFMAGTMIQLQENLLDIAPFLDENDN